MMKFSKNKKELIEKKFVKKHLEGTQLDFFRFKDDSIH